MISLWMRLNRLLIGVSLIAAIGLGIWVPELFVSISFLGDLFIKLLKLFALPLICSALIAAIGGATGSGSALKTMSRKLLGYMLISEILAVSIALTLFNLLKPGAHSSPDLIMNGQSGPLPEVVDFGLSRFLLSVIPDNIFQALAHFELLPVVVFSILFSIGCVCVGAAAQPLIQVAKGVREVSSKCLQGVMGLAPIGIFSLVGSGIAQSHLSGSLKENLVALFAFVGVLVLGLFLHALWQLIAVAIASGQKISHILSRSLPVFSTAFGTSSSVATLPVAMHVAEQLKAKPEATRFMLPLCASINVGGMMMYEMAAALFFTQMLGIDLSFADQCVLAVACILGGMAEGGIPETSMVSLVMVFRIVNIPLSAISILLPLDRIIDRLRTMVNIFGNLCGVILISQRLPDTVEELSVPLKEMPNPSESRPV